MSLGHGLCYVVTLLCFVMVVLVITLKKIQLSDSLRWVPVCCQVRNTFIHIAEPQVGSECLGAGKMAWGFRMGPRDPFSNWITPDNLGDLGMGFLVKHPSFIPPTFLLLASKDDPWNLCFGGGWGLITFSGWWFQICFIFTPIMGKIPNLTSIFFKWVETTNQF